MNVLNEIRQRYDSLSKANKKISDYILENAHQVQDYTAVELAKRCQTSSASIIRYVKHLGYKGLDDFKIELAKTLSVSMKYGTEIDLIISKEDSIDTLCNKVEGMSHVAFTELFDHLEYDQLKQAIDLIASARKVYLLGIGSSSMAAYDLYHKLNRLGYNALYSFDSHMTCEFLNYTNKEDVVVAISYSGQTQEIVYEAQIAKDRGTQIISITRNAESALAQLSDLCLYVPNTENVVRVGAITSLQTTLTLCSILYLGVMQKDFDNNEARLVETRKNVNKMKVNQ